MNRAVLAVLLACLPVLASAQAKEDPTAPVPRADARSQALHEKLRARAQQGGVDLLFLGDSITEFWNGNEVWRERYAPLKAGNFGIAGDKTQNVLWRLNDGEMDGLKPKAVVLLIGTNNIGGDGANAEETARGVSAVLNAVRARFPDSKVLLLGIFPRDARADAPVRTVVRDANARLAVLADGKTVRFLDIGPRLLEPDGSLSKDVMPDFLHPSLKGYGIWADAMAPALAEILPGAVSAR
jgi:lysophospholipase L1-like esterase